MSITRQSAHIFSRSSAAPWNIEWPDNFQTIASIAFRVPKGLAQRTQA
jgi:hypothetical protein